MNNHAFPYVISSVSKITTEHKLKVSEVIIALMKIGVKWEGDCWSNRWAEVLVLDTPEIAHEAVEYMRNYSCVDHKFDLNKDGTGTISIGYMQPVQGV